MRCSLLFQPEWPILPTRLVISKDICYILIYITSNNVADAGKERENLPGSFDEGGQTEHQPSQHTEEWQEEVSRGLSGRVWKAWVLWVVGIYIDTCVDVIKVLFTLKNSNPMQYNLVWKLSIELFFVVNSHKILNGTYNKTLMFLW